MNLSFHNKTFFSVIAIVLTFSISLQVYNSVVWQHYHRMTDGSIIVHAHPYNKTSDNAPIKNHQHSNSEFYFLQILKLLFPFTLIIQLAIPVFLSLFLKLTNICKSNNAWVNLASGRAPPLLY